MRGRLPTIRWAWKDSHLIALLIVGVATPFGGAALAQPGAGPEARSADPEPEIATDDAEASFRFAAEATARGDVPAAIAALERVLQTNPDLANIKLELGLLYLRAGNPDLARSYLTIAVNSPEAPEEARQRARIALRSASGALGRFGISGSAGAGLAFQTNPNGSPASVSITGPGGIPILISGDDLSIPRGSDLSATANASIEARYGLGGQRGNDLVLDVNVAQTNYLETTELDASYLNARLGPRIFTGPEIAPTGFVKPYVTGTVLALGGARYFSGFGAGIALLARPSLSVTVTGQIAYDRRNYNNSKRRPTAEEQTGDYWSGVAEIGVPLSPRTRLSVTGIYERVEAREEYWSRATYGTQLGFVTAIKPPSGAVSWLGRLTAAYRRSDYGAPDPLIDPVRRRDEDRFEVEAGLSIPLGATSTLDLRASQTWNKSNIANYDYRNTLGSLGFSFRF